MGLTRKTPLRNKAPMKAPRKRKCRECREWYQPWQSTQKACSVRCAQAVGRRELEKKQAREAAEARRQAKAERAERRKRKQELKTAKQLIQDLQPIYNRWVRYRDAGKPCISCGRYEDEIPEHFTGGKVDCGHYRSVGACPELRFEPLNTHLQCKYCNRDLDGNVVEYRQGLLERIGPDNLAWVEGPHPPKKYTRDQLLDMRAWYLADIRRMKRESKAA